MTVDIKKLKLNPFHSKIYQTNDLTDLVESIKDLGLLQKIVVNQDFSIISGVRRFLALKELNISVVDVEVKNVNKNNELLTLISYNKQRTKTNREILNEVKYLKGVWAQRRGRKTNTGSSLKGTVIVKVDTRKKISDTLGVCTGNISKLEYIENQKSELIDAIDKGEITINHAHKALKKFENEKKAIQFNNILPTTIENDYFKIYNKSSDDLSNLENESISCIFTSPPYWNKRTYSENNDELGAEKTSEEFVQRMANHLHQCHRVLKETGSFFLNMGDTFNNKSLELIPDRVVIELMKKGWIIRNKIIWKKTNPLPSSVKDNLTPSYEFIFHLVKSPKYYYNQILIPKKDSTKTVTNISQKGKKIGSFSSSVCINGLKKGKNIEDYWDVDIVTTATANQAAVKRYGGSDHPAPFPSEIISLPILQTSNPGDVVMDPFSGSGTTGEVALLLGRKYVGYEFNPNYNKVQTLRYENAISKYNNSKLNQSRQAA